MIVVDTSALIAILTEEADASRYASYALAKATDLPLLFKGRDFSGTDIRSALSA